MSARYSILSGTIRGTAKLPDVGPRGTLRVPSFNYDIEQSVRSMNEMDAFIKATGAQLWINHDSDQSRAIPKAPAFVE